MVLFSAFSTEKQALPSPPPARLMAQRAACASSRAYGGGVRRRRAAPLRSGAARGAGARHTSMGTRVQRTLLPALLRPRLTLTGSATQVAGACVVFVRRRVATRCP